MSTPEQTTVALLAALAHDDYRSAAELLVEQDLVALRMLTLDLAARLIGSTHAAADLAGKDREDVLARVLVSMGLSAA